MKCFVVVLSKIIKSSRNTARKFKSKENKMYERCSPNSKDLDDGKLVNQYLLEQNDCNTCPHKYQKLLKRKEETIATCNFYGEKILS